MRLEPALVLGLAAFAGIGCGAARPVEPAPERAPLAASAEVCVEAIADAVTRFDVTCAAKASALPSYALLDPSRAGTGAAPSSTKTQPEFGRDLERRHGFRIHVEDGTTLYGLGEHPGRLERSGQTAVLWNTDSYAYSERSASVYQSQPWVLAVRADGSAFGVLADTTYRVHADLEGGIEMYADGPPFPVLVIEGDSPQAVLRRLAALIGTIEMPPMWALGWHQCRYSYAPASRVLEIAKGFRSRRIPADTIWMDIDYMDAFRIFTFDPAGFPDPAGLNRELAELHFHNVWMINPGVASDPSKFRPSGYAVYDGLMAGDHAVRTKSGEVYQGQVWPGAVAFPDFTDPRTRKWWSTLYGPFARMGVAGVWNDMNEPAVFGVPEKTMPEDNVHRGEARFGGGGPHARFHNVYGMLMAEATREGMMAALPERRPFVLTRAGYLGSHRIAATWTGDNTASWHDLELSVPMILNLGLSGQPFVGPDVGGFVGDGDADLFARWIGFGALFPFARGHTAKNTRNKEPWAFGQAVEATAKAALENRYALLPYLYTLFFEAHVTGLPVWRPVFFADPVDPRLRAEDDAFLIGDALLVVPQLSKERDREPALPSGAWRRFTLFGAKDDDLPELRAAPGAIIPVGPVMEWTGQKPLDPLTLIINLDDAGTARGTLYEDDGDGWAFRDGAYRLTKYRAKKDGDHVVVEVEGREGSWPAVDRALKVRWLVGEGREVVGTGRSGAAIRVGSDQSASDRSKRSSVRPLQR